MTKLNLPSVSAQYDPSNEAQARNAIETADAGNLKRGEILQKLQFRDTATGHIKTVVMTSGAFVIT